MKPARRVVTYSWNPGFIDIHNGSVVQARKEFGRSFDRRIRLEEGAVDSLIRPL